MSKNNVGANLVFARRTTIVCEPMSVANVSNSFSNIGLISVFVRRANIKFAPTLVLLIGLILVFVRRANIRFAPTLVSEIGWISITTIYPKIYDRLLIIEINVGRTNVFRKLVRFRLLFEGEHKVRPYICSWT